MENVKWLKKITKITLSEIRKKMLGWIWEHPIKFLVFVCSIWIMMWVGLIILFIGIWG